MAQVPIARERNTTPRETNTKTNKSKYAKGKGESRVIDSTENMRKDFPSSL